MHARRTTENFVGHCRGTWFYSIRFEYVRAERAGNRRLREHEFTLLSGLMARISLCRGLRECKLEEGDRGGSVGSWRDGAERYTRDIVNGQPIWIAKLLSQRICDAATTTNWKYYHYTHYTVVRQDNANKYR